MTIYRQDGQYVAGIFYRDFLGRGRRIRRNGRSKAEASRRVLSAVKVALSPLWSGQFKATDTFEAAATAWLVMFEGQVTRGRRSPSTLDEYRYNLHRVVLPGVGSLRLGEISTPRLDHFVQEVLTERGYATAKVSRTVLSGVCGWLVRQGSLPSNPVRDLTPLEQDRDRTARALSIAELREWLARLDADPFAVLHDLPELARFMVATGARLGEALGVTRADVDLDTGTLLIQRTIIRVKAGGWWPIG